MKHIANVGLVLLALASSLACGAGDGSLAEATADTTAEPGAVEGSASGGSELPDDGAAVPPQQSQTLHEFDVAQTHYTILEVDGELLTAFRRPRYSPIARVVAPEDEPLTLLEMYLALQPQGVPHARLLEAHVQQAAELGRTDASVHAAFLELDSLVDKDLQEDCVTAAAGFTGGTFVAPFYTKSGQVTVLNGSFTSARATRPNGERGYMLLLACNFSSGAQTETVEFARKQGAFGAFVTQFSAAIPSGGTEGIIHNTGNRTIRFNLRARVITTPNVPMIMGTFGEDRL